MALYWPEKRVALDIVDDPHRRPFEGDESYTVLRVTCAQLSDYDSFRDIMRKLCKLLDRDFPDIPSWDEQNEELHATLFKWAFEEELLAGAWQSDEQGPEDYEDPYANIEILAPNEESADFMRACAEQEGRHVRGTSIWEGPTPKGSYEDISPNMRMSTPEFFFFRKANLLPFAEAVSIGNELCGKFRTASTQYTLDETYDFLSRPRTTRAHIRSYLRGARGTKECRRAKRILRHVVDECSSPMGNYLYLLLCLPKTHGGYEIERALMSGAFEGKDTLMPSSEGPYLAYDLSWPGQKVSLQYTGDKHPTERALGALNAGGMQTICVTSDEILDPDRFDAVARKLAKLLDAEVPAKDDEKWLYKRKRLRAQLTMPTFPCMRLTIDDISEHR